MNDAPGGPSWIHLGTQTAKGERWVSSGVGERMIEYLKRTYGGQAKRARRRAQRNFNFDRLAVPVRPAASHTYPRLQVCMDCGAEYRAVNAQNVRCPSCAEARRLARKRAYNKRRSERYPLRRPCATCGEVIVAQNAGQVRCATCQHKYELMREKKQRDEKRGRPRLCHQCGAPLGDVHRSIRFCSDRCRKAHKAAYNARYKRELRRHE